MKAVMEMRAEALSQGTGSNSSSSAPGKALEEMFSLVGDTFRFSHSFASIDVGDGTYWFDQDSRVLSAKTLGFLQQKCAYFMVPKFVMPTQHNFCVLKEHFIFGTKQLL